MDKDKILLEMEEDNWYACTTMPRGEKIADLGLTKLNITHFLPIINKVRKWSDRTKTVQFPLFNGYIFVYGRIGLSKYRRRILQAPKIAYLVQKQGLPILIPEAIIKSLRIMAAEWNENFSIENENIRNYLKEGDPVKIVHGPLKGVDGILLKKGNFPKIVVFVEVIGQGVSVEIDLHTVEKITELNK